MKQLLTSRWVVAFGVWAFATSLVGGGYALWLTAKAQPFRWDLLRDAALMTIPVALVLAWRDRGQKR